jgi:hypothetical protein
MLLQGIVENAVKFGPASRKAGGEVAYSVSLAANQLRLRVTSPGHLDTASASTAIGLRNPATASASSTATPPPSTCARSPASASSPRLRFPPAFPPPRPTNPPQ